MRDATAPVALGLGTAPEPSVPAPVLGTLFLIGGDIMLFAGLIFAFWVLRLAAPVWPPPLQPRLPVGVTAANTVVLLASSSVMVAATRTLARGHDGALARRLGLCGLLGSLFVAVQGYEWARLIGFGLTVSSGIYGALFYTLVGAHALHVLAALVWLGITAVRAGRGEFARGRGDVVRACALYWHFVVALWPLLYASVYLL
ncbi:MAG: heme-copper oxidase subunit III [Candidatus Rokubacteria bacterium]|nr:heme-copper oxidase subunit III [Candidatus Rokubacteria bacterium]